MVVTTLIFFLWDYSYKIIHKAVLLVKGHITAKTRPLDVHSSWTMLQSISLDSDPVQETMPLNTSPLSLSCSKLPAVAPIRKFYDLETPKYIFFK